MENRSSKTEIFQQHQLALKRWASAQTPGWLSAKLDPDDLVQQTLLEAVKSPETYQGKTEQEILSYLRRALTNNLIDAARKFGNTRHDITADQFADSSRKMDDWLAAPDTSPSERVCRNERYSQLAEGLLRLPDAQRIAIQMRYLQGLRVSEIARTLDRTEGAIAALLHRAVTALKIDLKA